MEVTSGILYAIQARITSKLAAAGATSRETAVTGQQADFSMKEQNCIGYIAGGMGATIKKTIDGRVYIPLKPLNREKENESTTSHNKKRVYTLQQ
jgi:hypothetical protein